MIIPFHFRTVKGSPLLTFFSFLGSAFGISIAAAGIASLSLPGFAAAAVGVLLMLGTDRAVCSAVERKRFRIIKKQISDKKLEHLIATDYQTALSAYRCCPGDPMIAYIRSLNANYADAIRRELVK